MEQETSSDQMTPNSTQRTATNRVRTRGIKRITWSVAEKEVIYACYSYSRSERWSRNKSGVFHEQLQKANLNAEKLELTSIKQFESLMSQVSRYINAQKLASIKAQALQEAERDYDELSQENQEMRKKRWLPEESWTLIWAIEYSKEKCGTNKSPIYTETWRNIMKKFCPDKNQWPRCTTQYANYKKSGLYSEHRPYLAQEIERYIDQGIDPLIHPIQMPGTSEGSNQLPPNLLPSPQQPRVSNVPPLTSFNPPTTIPPASPPHHSSPHPNSSPTLTPRSPPTSPPHLHSPSSRPSPPSLSPSNSLPPPISPPSPPTSLPPSNSPPAATSPTSTSPASQPNSPPNPSVNNTTETPQPAATRLPELDEENPLINRLAANISEAMCLPLKERQTLRKLFQNKKYRIALQTVNNALPKLIHRNATLTEINQIHYAAAITVQETVISKPTTTSNREKPRNRAPVWKIKMEKQVSKLRVEASRLSAYLNGQNSQGLKRKISQIKRKYRLTENRNLATKLTEIKMLITNKAKIIKNKEEKFLSAQQNKAFERDPKKFISSIMEDSIDVKTPPTENEIATFWKGIYEDSTPHNASAPWIREIEEEVSDRPKMTDRPITDDEMQNKLRTMKNFKSPGPDQITNFWLKQLTSLQPIYLAAFNRILSGQEEAPDWLTEGKTRLLPKNADTHLPNKYRPICCLPTTYKWLTAIIAERLYDHLDQNSLLSEQQKGCIRNCLGTKDQLLLNKAAIENCRKRATNLSMAWLDYQKAYDSVPHSWIRKCLKIYKLSDNLCQFIIDSMKRWSTNLHLRHENGEIILRGIKIKRGIFQGDSLSPLLFCLCIDPLSRLLNKMNKGYNFSPRGQDPQRIGHLLYMDDLKLYAGNDAVLKEQLKVVSDFSRDINMKFGLDKCATVSIEKGKLKQKEGITLQEFSIRALEEGETYKYLGVEETNMIDHSKMRVLHKEECITTIKKILKTKLNPKNKILAINMIAIPKIQYSFGIIEWPQHEINTIDVQIRKLLCQNKVIYKDQSHARMYLPRAQGGMGLIEVDTCYKATIASLGQYIVSKKGPYAEILKKHYSSIKGKSIIPMANIFLEPEKLNEGAENPTKTAKKTRRKVVIKRQKQNTNDWKNNKRAGHFAKRMDEKEIDKEKSYEWLKRGVLNFDSERIVLAAQDEGLYTNGLKKIFGLTTNDKCRFCQEAVETVNHLLSGCPKLLAEGRYTSRHNNVCRVIHWRLCQKYGFDAHEVSWKHTPEPFLENQRAKITYDQPIPTSRHISQGAVRPDIVVMDKITKRGYIIDVCVPNDYGIGRQEREKVVKYQDLKNSIRDTYGVNPVDIIPVVIGATGVMKRNLKNYLQLLPCSVTSLELQIEVVRETVSLMKRSLGCNIAT